MPVWCAHSCARSQHLHVLFRVSQKRSFQQPRTQHPPLLPIVVCYVDAFGPNFLLFQRLLLSKRYPFPSSNTGRSANIPFSFLVKSSVIAEGASYESHEIYTAGNSR